MHLFVYTLLSRFATEYDEELTIKVDGTLDDKSTATIVIEKNAIPVQVNQ